MKKQLLSLLLVGAMATSSLPFQSASAQEKAAPAAWDGNNSQYSNTASKSSIAWDGTTLTEPGIEEGAYRISTGAELAWFADYVNQETAKGNGLVELNAVLAEDIDLGGNNWTPISIAGYITSAYSGTFDGQYHTISGLKIETSATGYGLFASINGATIKNLKVSGTVNSSKGVGGIVGKIQAGTIENCSMAGSVTSTGTGTNGYAGGIVEMYNNNGATITGCHNAADISGSYAGGILGYNTKSATINHCCNTGDIITPENLTGITRNGGIAGQSSNGTISYCYSIGASTNGICGFSNATITNCYYLAENTSDDTAAPGGSATGYQQIADIDSLLEGLNAGGEMLFETDTAGKNQGYPILSWELASAVIPIPVTTVTILGDSTTGCTLAARALGEEDKSATNVSYQWTISDDNRNFTDIADATESTFSIPDTSEYAGKYLRVTVAGDENSSASATTNAIAKSEALTEKENKEHVAQAIESLSLETTVFTEESTLHLPTELAGCSIQWDSSNPNRISTAGAVTPPGEGVEDVTLTATVSCGSATDTKTFTIQVWGKNIDTEQYLKNALESIKWDYKNLIPVYGKDTNVIVKFQQLLKKRGYDKLSVTIESTEDESLISKNGKVTYPAIPESGLGANGKQVQVYFRLTAGDATATWPEGTGNALLVPWDTSSVIHTLASSADELLTEQTICGDAGSLDSVTSDLTLPSCIRGEKYSFAWITWESSEESHLNISNEGREGNADALYNPYIGKIHQDDREHTLTLKATITNPSTDVTVYRTFEVTIRPMEEEKLSQTLDTMNRILDFYTPDKLTDFATKKQLDTDGVSNDIQLVIPRNVVTSEELAELNDRKYWDYWNYKFTVTSSDTDLVTINSFRAFVYRPLGEDSSADRKTTLTVRMESKDNPNLSVTKDIPITVKHLGRAEINDALALMDQAKSEYARGLLGNNADTYSIIDNLTPYREIVWNNDRSGVDFIYANADRKNSGIIVDELPGWESQEDWRTFRSSDKDLLSNETLILNGTPAEDSFVRINSVLTDETLGKYYTKFKDTDGYDPEALAKFRQLYRQPASAYVMAVGSGNYTDNFISMTVEKKYAAFSPAMTAYKQELEQPLSVTFSLLGLDGTPIISKTTENSFTKGATVFDVFKKVLADNDIPYTAKGSYITSINGLAEYDHGANSGWMYTVGDVLVNSYMNAQELTDGEDIIVKYVTDYTQANKPQKTPDGNTPGSNNPGDSNSGSNNPGDSNSGSNNPGDNNPSNSNPGGSNPGGSNPGGSNPGGSNPGGSNSGNGNSGSAGQPPKNSKTDNNKNKKRTKRKKIKTLKLTKYRKGTKKIQGKTLKKSKVTVQVGKKKYKVTSNKKGRFTVALKKKLKKKNKIRITVSKKGYLTRKKTFTVRK